MYLSYAPRCHWLLSKVIKHVFQRAATAQHTIVITAILQTKVKLELVACDAAIYAHADTVASKHIGNLHTCTILVMEKIIRGDRGWAGGCGGSAENIDYLRWDPVHLPGMHITLFMQAAGVLCNTLQARAVQRPQGTAKDIHTQKPTPQPDGCKQRGG